MIKEQTNVFDISKAKTLSDIIAIIYLHTFENLTVKLNLCKLVSIAHVIKDNRNVTRYRCYKQPHRLDFTFLYNNYKAVNIVYFHRSQTMYMTAKMLFNN